MRVRRLGWAGLEVEAAGKRLLIDYVRDMTPLFTGWLPGIGLTAPSGKADAALVTHLHRDHIDPAALVDVLLPGVPLLRPGPSHGDNEGTLLSEREIIEHRLPTEVVDTWSSHDLGPFRVTAVPSLDGLGDPQVSWVVEAEGQRVFHGGDTMFHGWWWSVARRFSPFDAVFVPANGAIVEAPHLQPPSPLTAAMNPLQASVAANILNARYAVPIHYEVDQPFKRSGYVEVADPAKEFRDHVGQRARVLDVGEWLDLAS